ncbi:MAG TPA: VOC family protein [Thermoanaerobaculia bacterium]|nr:VOC family protein [Thermoanaerobaculia bacterium]
MTTRGIFADASAPLPATPGTYGEAPTGFRLPPGTAPGLVRLQVADLERSLDYYQGTLGLLARARDGESAMLGARGPAGDDATPLVELRELRGAKRSPHQGRLGLFHFAILLPDRPSLARFVLHLGELGIPAGQGDHLVSEAFYLTDPDGLGIEVYADRPREAWRRKGRELMMTTDPLDLEGLVREAGGTPWTGIPDGSVMGHLHLHVGDLAAASRFYSEALGFDRTVWSYPGALFLAAGGYHHHLGANVWAGPTARPPADDAARLLEWTLDLPDAASLQAATESLTGAGYSAELIDGAAPEVVTRDPWETTLRLRARA